MILTCLFEFNTHNEGLNKMQDFEYPCAFIVNGSMFDYQGNPITITENYFLSPNDTMTFISGYGDENTIEGVLYVQDYICKVNKIG